VIICLSLKQLMYALVFGIVSLVSFHSPLATDTILPLSRAWILKNNWSGSAYARKHCLQIPNILRMVQINPSSAYLFFKY